MLYDITIGPSVKHTNKIPITVVGKFMGLINSEITKACVNLKEAGILIAESPAAIVNGLHMKLDFAKGKRIVIVSNQLTPKKQIVHLSPEIMNTTHCVKGVKAFSCYGGIEYRFKPIEK